MSLIGEGQKSFIREQKGVGLRVKVTEANELSRPTEVQLAEASERLSPELPPGAPRKRGWPKGKKRLGVTRKTKIAVMGIRSEILNAQNPRWAEIVRQAAAYRKARIRELSVVHGYVSAGVAALLAAASLALASSRFLYEIAGNVDVMDMGDRLKKASMLADSARQNELAAWELCSREAVQKRKATASEAGVPWIKSIDQPSNAGRPTKREVAQREGAEIGLNYQDVRVAAKELSDTVENNNNSVESLVPWNRPG